MCKPCHVVDHGWYENEHWTDVYTGKYPSRYVPQFEGPGESMEEMHQRFRQLVQQGNPGEIYWIGTIIGSTGFIDPVMQEQLVGDRLERD